MYDIMITQSYSLIRQSLGLCVTKHPSCRLERGANLSTTRRRRNADIEKATYICNQYMSEGYKAAQRVLGNRGSKMTEHARTACIDDILSTGEQEVS